MRCFVQNKQIQSVEIDDELVMVSQDQAHFIALNAIGKFIFDCLQTPKSEADIVLALQQHFEVDANTARQDLSAYLQQLLCHQLVLVDG